LRADRDLVLKAIFEDDEHSDDGSDEGSGEAPSPAQQHVLWLLAEYEAVLGRMKRHCHNGVRRRKKLGGCAREEEENEEEEEDG